MCKHKSYISQLSVAFQLLVSLPPSKRAGTNLYSILFSPKHSSYFPLPPVLLSFDRRHFVSDMIWQNDLPVIRACRPLSRSLLFVYITTQHRRERVLSLTTSLVLPLNLFSVPLGVPSPPPAAITSDPFPVALLSVEIPDLSPPPPTRLPFPLPCGYAW